MRPECMGSNGRVGADEAARLVGVSRKHLQRLVRQGMLRPHYERERGLNAPMAFDKEELAALIEVREADSFDVRRVASTATQALAIARQLERRVSLLERALGRRVWPLPLEEDFVVALYSRALHEQDTPRNDIDGVMDWARTFIAIGDEFLDVLEAYTGDESCWRPFVDIGQVMVINAPYDQLAYDVELKVAYSYLEVGRRNLRDAAFMYTRNRFGSHIANERFNSADECHLDILSLLTESW